MPDLGFESWSPVREARLLTTYTNGTDTSSYVFWGEKVMVQILRSDKYVHNHLTIAFPSKELNTCEKSLLTE